MLWVPDVGLLASLWLNQKKKNSPFEANMNRFEHLEEQVVPMRAWRVAGAPECGHWVHVGRMEEIYNCVVDWVPHRSDCKYVALCENVKYASLQLHRCRERQTHELRFLDQVENLWCSFSKVGTTSWLNAKQANSGQKLGQALKRPN